MAPHSDMDATSVDTAVVKAASEGLIPRFQLGEVLNQDQRGRRITLLGTIDSLPALLILERAAFPSESPAISSLIASLAGTTNLGTNDIYKWYMSRESSSSEKGARPNLKVNLLYPCTPAHIRKYKAQKLRYVTESSEVYKTHVRSYVERTQRIPERLVWIYNILDGIKEAEDVIYRTPGFGADTSIPESQKKGFIMLPDLNWDRKTVEGLHLLALLERRDVWSLRDLKKRDVSWLKEVRKQAVSEAAKHGTRLARQNGSGDGADLEEDMLKCYVHYQPTYYHFHIHVVHVMLEAEGTTQSVGKAFSLENLISQLDSMSSSDVFDAGLDQIDISYFVGEESELWKKCFARLRIGERVDLND